MSAPNKSYDPVEVTTLKPEAVDAARDAAIAAFAAAIDLAELKEARLEHAGDRSALALANRVYMINNGHMAYEGPAAEIKARPEILHRHLGV